MSMKKYDPLLSRGVEEIIGLKELNIKIASGKKLRIKHGVDPTTEKLTLGHAVNYQKLLEFQEAGHKVVFLIGDFTARFGDPSDKDKARKLRDKKEVKEMSRDYLKQIGVILDLKKTEIRYNSEWYDSMSAEQLIKIMSCFTVDRMLERDMFVRRRAKHEEIGLHELIYPVLQGFDSVMLKSDVTICGTDQKFNELQGRKLQRDFNQDPQSIITVPMLVGTDGKQKMSQSLGNDIGILEEANGQFGKIMSIPDAVIGDYYELAARTSGKELSKIKKMLKDVKNRRGLKAALARDIVNLYHGSEAALVAEGEFNRIFRDKLNPNKMQEFKIKKNTRFNILELLMELQTVKSKSEARRLVEQHGVRIDGSIIEDPKATICLYDGMVVRVGKMKFVKIRSKD